MPFLNFFLYQKNNTRLYELKLWHLLRLFFSFVKTKARTLEFHGFFNCYAEKGREQSVLRRHPWVFSGAIQKKESSVADGDCVAVVSHAGVVLGYGHYQRGTIAVRLLTFEALPPTPAWWREKVGQAYMLRQTLVEDENTNCFRWIHGEADGLPGLIIDYYNGVAVMQAHSVGMHLHRQAIADALREVLGARLAAVYYRSQTTLSKEVSNEYLAGMVALPHAITEHGHHFLVDWEEGQKTGFFLDQRENRQLLGRYCRGKRVLNTFCYTGGFSVYALAHQAAVVHSVDASEKAIALTRKNIELNGFSNQAHPSFVADTFEFLKDKTDEYDVMVLDPPAFAKHRDARHQAMKGYQRLNAEAMRKIKPGGVLFTFSCSQVVDKQLFYDTVVSAGVHAGRDIRVLQHLGQPADHPVSLFHPEGEYLKGLVLYVG
jgi:23S rRNA (cytosine1962-C5)-methyltransferase